MFQNMQSILPLVIGVSGLAAIALASYWFFNKEAKKRHLEELRRTYENMSPADPQYDTARKLFIAAAITDAAAHNNLGNDVASNGTSGSGDGVGED